ncbi:tetratricopeptide repeat protein [Butyrivibrio sp. WCD3002]|uniref:tetratricopeptide repeat protein n=1 Tax=Butyrivibrio sp. WCD3002 TaxID=1280676 RepID=UPI00042535DF|nr:hypothetical protein [Butyrivibrio sp. WCD3002]
MSEKVVIQYSTNNKRAYIVLICLVIIGFLFIIASMVKAHEKECFAVEKEFKADIESELSEMCTDPFKSIIDYHVNNLTYSINRIIKKSDGSYVIDLALYAFYDYSKYGDQFSDSLISYDLEDLVDRYKLEKDGFKVSLVGDVYINGNKNINGSDSLISNRKVSDSFKTKILTAFVFFILLEALLGFLLYKEIQKNEDNPDALNRAKMDRVVLILSVGICICCVIGYFVYAFNKSKLGDNRLADGDYEGAIDYYTDSLGYPNALNKLSFSKALFMGEYEDAYLLSKQINNGNTYVEPVLYQKALEYIEGNDYKKAAKLIELIPDYEGVSGIYDDVKNYELYYDALEYETESLSGALELYKQLPSDFEDVSARIKEYEKYMPFVGINYGSGSFISEYYYLDDFYCVDGKIFADSGNWEDIEIKPSNKSGYELMGTWDEYNRTIYLSLTEANVVDGGINNILKANGRTVAKGQKSGAAASGTNSSSGRCSNCGGTGYVKYYYGGSNLEAYLSGHDAFEIGVCGMCNGSGKSK